MPNASKITGTATPPVKFTVGLKSEMIFKPPLPFVKAGLLLVVTVLFATVLPEPELPIVLDK